MNAKTNDVLTTDLLSNLKGLFEKELDQVPAYMESLEPKERLDYLLKLMPYVLPKVSSVDHDQDEPVNWNL
jgi:hypothetical protein